MYVDDLENVIQKCYNFITLYLLCLPVETYYMLIFLWTIIIHSNISQRIEPRNKIEYENVHKQPFFVRESWMKLECNIQTIFSLNILH